MVSSITILIIQDFGTMPEEKVVKIDGMKNPIGYDTHTPNKLVDKLLLDIPKEVNQGKQLELHLMKIVL